MPTHHDGSPNDLLTDVLVIGGGLSGLASAIHLARGGIAVTLLEPQTVMPPIVGESLDWSAPGLLAALGLPIDELIASRAANWKSHIVMHRTDGSKRRYQPGQWLAERPWNVEIRTLHLDRQLIHSMTEEMAR
jgi:2-polyprenyl-6-methoxyphenol hydroxylase-like FAD-dependent oxidoreductase